MQLFLSILLLTCCPHDPTCSPPSAREERALFSCITEESYRLYNSLDCLGKNRVMELLTEYEDPNCAIQEAARELGQRQLEEYYCTPEYKRRTEESGGQSYEYSDRFGH